ncbi:hypothetical protein GGX14DRAFT_400141 [Mycena pura]|uniref:Uncharacterized protein n=1 Tax=Mycena pura TaxID=153505 RepID=A0AAD6VAA8_9AGAR|nr:hypothetical protein GGX14DRAFT_400141 [Mycena pura]
MTWWGTCARAHTCPRPALAAYAGTARTGTGMARYAGARVARARALAQARPRGGLRERCGRARAERVCGMRGWHGRARSRGHGAGAGALAYAGTARTAPRHGAGAEACVGTGHGHGHGAYAAAYVGVGVTRGTVAGAGASRCRRGRAPVRGHGAYGATARRGGGHSAYEGAAHGCEGGGARSKQARGTAGAGRSRAVRRVGGRRVAWRRDAGEGRRRRRPGAVGALMRPGGGSRLMHGGGRRTDAGVARRGQGQGQAGRSCAVRRVGARRVAWHKDAGTGRAGAGVWIRVRACAQRRARRVDGRGRMQGGWRASAPAQARVCSVSLGACTSAGADAGLSPSRSAHARRGGAGAGRGERAGAHVRDGAAAGQAGRVGEVHMHGAIRRPGWGHAFVHGRQGGRGEQAAGRGWVAARVDQWLARRSMMEEEREKKTRT